MNKGSSKIFKDALICVAFCLVILTFFLCNIKTFCVVLNEQLQREDSSKGKLLSVEKSFQENICGKDMLTNFYGMALKTLNWRIVGNYEFVKDEAGIIQHIINMSHDNYISSMSTLLSKLKERDTICINVNLPDRGGKFSAAQDLTYNCKRYENVDSQLVNEGLKEFNVQEELIDSSKMHIEDFFFHTDIHLTTKAEFNMAKSLTEFLSEKYQIVFPNTVQVYNSDNYIWTDYVFCGNFCKSCGQKFTDLDNFQTFIPKFETEMRLTLPDGTTKQGDFGDVMTNQYDGRTDSPYWVTNYGQWPTLYYEYDNLNFPNAPRLLVLCDSMFMRANTFLALNASHVTVLDPRYINGNEYVIDCLLDSDFDAVIVCHTDYFNNNLFLSSIFLPEIVKSSQEISYFGMWLDLVNDCDLNSNTSPQGEIPIQVLDDSNIISMSGWAADFTVDQPLSALYLKVGDKTIRCNYGLERTSVSDYFGIGALKNTGFEVKFPKSYLDYEKEIEFIQVGADGTYRFESVKYQWKDVSREEIEKEFLWNQSKRGVVEVLQ